MISTRYLTEFQLLGIDCDVAHLEKLVGLYTEVLKTGATFVNLTKFYRYRTLLHQIKPDSKVFKEGDGVFKEVDVTAYGKYVSLEEAKEIIEHDNENDYIVADIPVGLEFKASYTDGKLTNVLLKTGSAVAVDITEIANTFMPTFIDAFIGVCDEVYGVFYIDIDVYKKNYKTIYEDIKLTIYDILMHHPKHIKDLMYKLTYAHILDWEMFSTRADAFKYIHYDIEEYQMVDFMTLHQDEVCDYIEYGIYAQHGDFLLDRLIILYANRENESQYDIKEDALSFKAKVKEVVWIETDIGRRPYAVIDEVLIHDTIKVNRVDLFALGVVLKYDVQPGTTINFKYSRVKQEAELIIPNAQITMLDEDITQEEEKNNV